MTSKQAAANTPSPISIAAKGYAVDSASTPFKLFNFERRMPAAGDVFIRIHYCVIRTKVLRQAPAPTTTGGGTTVKAARQNDGDG
ncbi:unnamed protein product [Adineta steineri]|uniref:Uncharacterized protein n=1 Tax=Adineta steineri TaxID=433720 RepID=A0A813SKY4_9BILA|nr:unnamed protein product [Adineta steineri]